MESLSTPPDEFSAVFDLQYRHMDMLKGSSILNKIEAASTLDNDSLNSAESWPIVLGSENCGIRFLFIAIQSPVDLNNRLVRSHYFTLGRSMGGVIYPNSTLDVTDEEFIFVDGMFEEAKDLAQSVAPRYSLESGILRIK